MPHEIPSRVSEQLKPYGIVLGAPVYSPDMLHINVPVNPHIFFCQNLYLLMPPAEIANLPSQWHRKVVDVVLTQENQSGDRSKRSGILLNDVMVMLGHGLVFGATDKDWVFQGTRIPVSDTISVYEQTAKEFQLPHLDVVIACRPPSEEYVNASPYVSFSRREIPYIRSDTTAHILNTLEQSSFLKPGNVANLVAYADRWNDMNWWFNYWSYYQRAGNIPDWARNAAMGS